MSDHPNLEQAKKGYAAFAGRAAECGSAPAMAIALPLQKGCRDATRSEKRGAAVEQTVPHPPIK